MELSALRTFVAVAEWSSFSRAAQALHIAQPAVSQQIKRLERQLGAPLFDRSTRRVTLTAAGQALLPKARAILGDVEQAETAVLLAAAGRSGRVRVGFVGTATYDLLPAVVRAVGVELPEIDLEVYGEQLGPALTDALAAGQLDIAVTRNPLAGVADSAGITLHPLRHEELIAAVPSDHAMVQSATVTLASLADETFITHPSGHHSVMYDAVISACREVGFTPRDIIEVRETATLITFVAAGMGVALVPQPVTSLSVRGVEYRTLSDVSYPTQLVMAYRKGSPAVARVAEVVAELTTG